MHGEGVWRAVEGGTGHPSAFHSPALRKERQEKASQQRWPQQDKAHIPSQKLHQENGSSARSSWGFPALVLKNPPYRARGLRDAASVLVRKISWRKAWQSPLQIIFSSPYETMSSQLLFWYTFSASFCPSDSTDRQKTKAYLYKKISNIFCRPWNHCWSTNNHFVFLQTNNGILQALIK